MLKLLHFTRGGVWHGRTDQGYAMWLEELAHLLATDNPKAEARITQEDSGGAPVLVELAFYADRSEVS